MRIIIAGSRTIKDYKLVKECIDHALCKLALEGNVIEEIVSGNALGVDKLAVRYAIENNRKYILFPANWQKYGKKAGYLRNIEMANYADALITIWDGKSPGTKMMIDIATKKGLLTYIYKI